MKKTFHTHNFVFCITTFSALLFFGGVVFLLADALNSEEKPDIVILLGVIECLLFSAFAIHYGSFYISLSNNIIEWKKEKYDTAASSPFYKRFLFGITGQKLVSTLVKEQFHLNEIAEYGLFEDFDDIDINEEMPLHSIKKQILVFKLTDHSVFYINTKWFSKQQIGKFLSEVHHERGIFPKEICAKTFLVCQ